MISISKLIEKVEKINPNNHEGSWKYIDIASVDRFQKKIVLDSVSDITADSAPSRARQLVLAGDIIISTVRPNLNTVAIVPKELDGAIASTGFCVLRPNKEMVDTKYLFHYIKSDDFVGKLVKLATGANYPAVSDKIIKEQYLKKISLCEQKNIAAILDKAEGIRQKREKAIKLADDFLCATFLEMFGDPVENPKGWQRMKFSEVGTLDRGKSKHRPRNAPELLGGIHPLIQTGDVANSGGYITDYFSTYSDIGLAQSKMWKKGTLCITIAANIAKTGILTFDACFPDSVVGFQPNQHVEIEFIQHWLGFLQKQLEETAPEVAQKNINLAILRDLDVIVPDKALQMKFKGVVKKVRELKEKYHNFPDIQPVLSSFHLS
ncbi:restriction endonuclease subunit S [Klebsiella grimontii]|uniref:restriction endonuclease subunit S n=1 Tax=Klebsiella grimontii TaxID=2058152 RepID=UPI001CCCE770|nr:restriction endonuclease subunit S [Klebsiella grimontii]MBZ6731535.1 restriction endonuclease subunit S [Klebsiella grimontii]MBZ7384446.1 restriction endonuclease subunit S [Klebsiella grimontii]MDT8625697.1 restriction endonuclease subunit S [Klebsiella grimontii]UNF12335.1 restriction endonuclease subunit S [Klebsiella grimontii]